MKTQIEQSEYIKKNFKRYIRSTFDIRDPEYKVLFQERLNELAEKLYKGPYVVSQLPFQQSSSLREMVDNHFFCDEFLKMPSEVLDRKCYKHQTDCFKRIKDGNNVVVTTGTSSGKTECFLYPILDALLRDIEDYKKNPSIRVIFLFPLNALVNDQMRRLRDILKLYPDINFAYYTGETPEDRVTHNDRNTIKNIIERNGCELKNEFLTRKEIKEKKPQILFTNYSMLEYLLIRPSDQDLISFDGLHNLKFIVLDEAHVYKGSLAIEIALLLRRLQAVARHQPQFIITSATLGRGKEDLPSIIDFANRLTTPDKGKEYKKEDIIFASRYNIDTEIKYSVDPNDYIELYDNIDNIDKFKEVFNKYYIYDNDINISMEEDDDEYQIEKKRIKANLYNLLSHDQHMYDLYYRTKNIETFNELKDDLMIYDDQSLSALINLISMSFKDGLKLLDIKYHMFVKAPDGAFITIGKKKDLSLTTVTKIDDNKAFKIGICQNCKTPYIMGITDENNILCIDDEIDIDEIYEDKTKKLEYYLLDESLTDDERDNIKENINFKEYYVCSKCGHIKQAGKEGKTCEHFDKCKVKLYKFVGSNELGSIDNPITNNNLNKCPVCNYKSTNGKVIMGFHIGKDRATGLLAQILYDSMEYPKKKVKSHSLFGSAFEYKELKKQYLIFSDSRQQAAFFPKFLNMTHRKFLHKVLIWNILKENNFKSLDSFDLLNKLQYKYEHILNYDSVDAQRFAEVTLLWELMLVDGRNSGEGLALYNFEPILNPDINDEMISDFLNTKYPDITVEEFKKLMFISLTVFRTKPAIDYGNIGSSEELPELLGCRNRKHKFIFQDIRKEKDQKKEYEPIIIDSFMPVKNAKTGHVSTNNTIKFIEKVFTNGDHVKACNILEDIFNLACEEKILEKDSFIDNYYYISDKKYRIKSNKETKFYRCNKCNKITPYNIRNKCIEPGCDGKLELIDIENDEKLNNNYYRNEYISRRVENVVCKEHTAQLKHSLAIKIQDDFKNGLINSISCSTTFEMGIDLGGLSTVFMRNIPPTPANYAQRAGRAGRRADTSAFILTFCSTSSHDYTYFENPKEMIKGLVRPPYFMIENEKIILRHISSTAISYFFRLPGNGKKFDSVISLIDNYVIDDFIDFLKSKPIELGKLIDDYVLKTDNLKQIYGDFKWVDKIISENCALKKMEYGLIDKINLYKDAREKCNNAKEYDLYKMYDDSLKRLDSGNSLLKELAEYNVIPSYGFPINTVALYIYDDKNEKFSEKYNLTRDLTIALSEYAPDSEIIVDEHKYTSRYLFLPYRKYVLPRTYYVECPSCHIINTSEDDKYFDYNNHCKYCGGNLELSENKVKQYITPIYGFVAEKNNITGTIKPFKTYASDVYYVGKTLPNSSSDDIVTIQTFDNEKLLILNENRFYTCYNCGYTVLDKHNQHPTKTVTHKNYELSNTCKDNDAILHLTHLGHSFSTDIVKIGFPNNEDMKDKETALSVLFAILEGISITFEIERSDINGILYRSNDAMPHDLILYDTVAGGSGHVKRLADSSNKIEVLRNALKKVSQDCCSEDTSCYNCLRTYNNQKIHKYLKRGKAKNCLEKILNDIECRNVKFKKSTPYYSTDGLDISEIINCLENYEIDEDSKKVLYDLFKELDNKNKSYPDSLLVEFVNPISEKQIICNLLWGKEKIALFTLNNIEAYNEMSQMQNEYRCEILSENFDYISFVKSLEGGR